MWTLVIILVILWLVGWIAIPSIGSLIHILIVVALILLIVNLIRGRK